MVTRQFELTRLLGQLAEDLPEPHWVALVDEDGLLMACVPADPPIDTESVSAMTAAGVTMGERVVNEIQGGDIRYLTVAGSDRQQLTVVLSRDRLLTVGLNPDVPAQSVFGPLSRLVPEIVEVLKKRYRAS
ncbi:MAG: roadblock/LC7 domain-containing protein [Anaerolineales bacterium]|jgi:predicted regulator of Ras-like GTPase activity (Roadblock/LC7/MglB family)